MSLPSGIWVAMFIFACVFLCSSDMTDMKITGDMILVLPEVLMMNLNPIEILMVMNLIDAVSTVNILVIVSVAPAVFTVTRVVSALALNK